MVFLHTSPSNKRTSCITEKTFDTSHYGGNGSNLTIRRVDYFDGSSFVRWVTNHSADTASGLSSDIDEFLAHLLEHVGGLKPDGTPFSFRKVSYSGRDGKEDFYFSKW